MGIGKNISPHFIIFIKSNDKHQKPQVNYIKYKPLNLYYAVHHIFKGMVYKIQIFIVQGPTVKPDDF